MDPKQNPQLDPKLQAAYDRVMGISLDSSPQPTPPANTPSLPTNQQPTDTTPPTLSTSPINPQVTSPQDATNPFPPSPMAPVTNATDPLVSSSPALDSAPQIVSTPPTTDPFSSIPTPSMQQAPSPDSTPPTVTPPLSAPTESLSATIPLAHSTEVVAIGSTRKSEAKKGISPTLILFGGIVFLIVYVLFWVKVFGLSIPFINQ